MFFRTHSYFNGIFLLIQVPDLLALLSILSGGGLRAIILGKFFWSFYSQLSAIFSEIECKIGILCIFFFFFVGVTFDVEVLLCVYRLVVNVCENLVIFAFNEDV